MIKLINKRGMYSIKRKLANIEKIIIIYLAFFCFPFGLSISSFYISEINPFSSEVIVPMLPAWLLITIVLIASELGTKNVSSYRGLISSTLISLAISYASIFAIMCLYFLIGYYPKNYIIFATFIAGYYNVLLFITRVVFYILNKKNKKVALILGPKEDVYLLARKLIKENRKEFRVKYLFFEENLNEELLEEKFKECNTIILLNTLSFKNKQKYLLYFNSILTKDVYLCTTYFDIVLMGNNVRSINDILSFEQKPLRFDPVENCIKRIFDIIGASLILILSSPVWLVVPLIIKLQDGGSVFYKQVRLTIDQKEFYILKFRSMRMDAEKKGGAQLAKSNDARITKFGKFIRATRIDEIPQVLNVLKGDMSLVGPRPERPEFVSKFLEENENYKYRFNVKAGVTGLQQVLTTYHTTYDDKLRYDLYYIANYNVLFDVKILFLTVKTVLSKSMAEGVDDSNATFDEFLEQQKIDSVIRECYYHLSYRKS